MHSTISLNVKTSMWINETIQWTKTKSSNLTTLLYILLLMASYEQWTCTRVSMDCSPSCGFLTSAHSHARHGGFPVLHQVFHACIKQMTSLVVSPPTFNIFLHFFFFVDLKCSCKYLSTVKGFCGGSIMKSFARSPWMASHCAFVCNLNLQIDTPKWMYATSLTLCCQYVLQLKISSTSLMGILTSYGCPITTHCFTFFCNSPWNFFASFFYT
jgi:hypothetical protein